MSVIVGLFQRLSDRRALARRQQALEDGLVHDAAHNDLAAELRAALLEDPKRVVQAPAFGGLNSWTAVEVIADDDAAPDSTVLADLLKMVGRLAKTGDAEAIAWIDAAAKRYADFHVDDLVEARMRESVEVEP